MHLKLHNEVSNGHDVASSFLIEITFDLLSSCIQVSKQATFLFYFIFQTPENFFSVFCAFVKTWE